MKHFKGYKIDENKGNILSNSYNNPKSKKFTEEMEKYKEKQKKELENKTNNKNKTNKVNKTYINLKRDKFAQLHYKKNYDELNSCDKNYIDNEMRDFYS